jgi:hypothetical protein
MLNKIAGRKYYSYKMPGGSYMLTRWWGGSIYADKRMKGVYMLTR